MVGVIMGLVFLFGLLVLFGVMGWLADRIAERQVRCIRKEVESRERSSKVHREVCEHCQYRGMPNGCEGCLAGIAYDCEDLDRHRLYYREFANTNRLFRERCDIRDAKRYKQHGHK